jgi:hypothetical protein
MEEPTYHGSCFCGAVQLEVRGAPAAAGYCHCASCRSWSAGPVNAFSLWKPQTVRITRGEEQIASHQKTARSVRCFCKQCGGHLFTKHPHWQLTDVYVATIPDYPFQPAVHVNYAESVLPLRDGLPKFKDLPSDMGGSGELITE